MNYELYFVYIYIYCFCKRTTTRENDNTIVKNMYTGCCLFFGAKNSYANRDSIIIIL